jgi:hypothetical protein
VRPNQIRWSMTFVVASWLLVVERFFLQNILRDACLV